MAWTDNPFVASFLDDMVEVGIGQWAIGAVLLTVVTLFGALSFIPFGGILGGIMAANLWFATGVTIYWKYIGQPKRAFTSVLGLVEENPRMERKDND